ncbi:response regulator transcription factor [Aquimarina pacifica]|uniref:response regulator transcription factor n=1 Tax=Aquimarina pacifica TaxID=1296415 RepID=UPI00046F1719|nr:LuxR C-terminal-related transcriptional regulator [Aquimarina pacifica]
MRFLIAFIILIINIKPAIGQYKFSGLVDEKNKHNLIYLSLIEDYRKISGIYAEQIIEKTTIDSTGAFYFSGDNLPVSNHIYRIHIENCSENKQTPIHFDGFCPESKQILFIANNTDTIELPITFDQEMFCTIVSNNEKSNAFLKVDSIIDEMRFAFASYRSEANRKINNKKWFKTLQQFAKKQQEPLVELYTHSFLSEKRNNLYAYYLEDLENNSHYDNLLNRLQQKYPNSPYTNQYQRELSSDRFLINPKEVSTKEYWLWILLTLLSVSVLINIVQFLDYLKRKKINKRTEKKLTQQEQKVLQFILEDKTNKEIASAMFVSISTIKTHINNLYKKLNVRSREDVKSLYTNKQ